MMVDLVFPILGDTLPTDHGYLLYSALAHLEQSFHAASACLRFSLINGERGGKGLIRLLGCSHLRMRLPAEQIGVVLPVTGQNLKVGDHSIRVGVPTVAPLTPACSLGAKVVTYKNAMEPTAFLKVTQRRLNEMGIGGEPGIPLVQSGKSAGEPRRKVVRIKGKVIVGFPLLIEGLTAEESLRLQEQGLGGRTRMGCGFFVPYRPRLS